MNKSSGHLSKIREHWSQMAENGLDLTATTKSSTIKRLEVHALAETLKKVRESYHFPVNSLLEVGCGNGHNLVSLCRLFPDIAFHGVDYIEKMVANAKALAKSENCPIEFSVGNILELDENARLAQNYDVVFTDRCLINLSSPEIQSRGFASLAKKVIAGGFLIIIENFVESYTNQNKCRQMLGLNERHPDSYNTFIHEAELRVWAVDARLELLEVNNFGSLHDLMLYVLLPSITNGSVDYSHPLMEAVTELSLKSSDIFMNQFGEFGQNRLYLFRKKNDCE